MKHQPILRTLTLLSLTVTAAGAQTANRPPVRQLPTPTATSADVLGSLAAVRHLPDGNVLVNDQAGRRLLLLDSTLKRVAVVADSSSGANGYGARAGGLIAYRGDSTLFVDPAALSMLVIDPAGKITRVMAAPRPDDVNFLVGGPFGNPGFDAQGRLVYRPFRFNFTPPAPGQPFVPPPPPESAAVIRYDLAARKLDTAGFFKLPKVTMTTSTDANGGVRRQAQMNPLPVVDDWAVLSDGTIAFVRGQDYHVDFVGPDGTRTTGSKIPYEWQRMTDEDKVAFVDSTRAAVMRARAAGGTAAGVGGPGGNATFGAAPQGMTITIGGPPGGGGGGGGGAPQVVVGGAPPGAGGPLPPPVFVSPSELPDYKPVFGPGGVRADADARVWVRTIPTRPTPGGAIYEVIDRTGKVVDRVQVPTGTTIIGFGPGGVVYLGMRDASGIHLQRARLPKL
ncbi:MAG: hypothetical protein ACJ8AD_09990 [Gemmatimonadaceae bacterium]